MIPRLKHHFNTMLIAHSQIVMAEVWIYYCISVKYFKKQNRASEVQAARKQVAFCKANNVMAFLTFEVWTDVDVYIFVRKQFLKRNNCLTLKYTNAKLQK